MRKTKIVATLGPATESRETIEELITLGVNVFRLNFSHGDHRYHGALIGHIRAIAGRLDKPVAILQDISGPKIRVGDIDGIMRLHAGDRLQICSKPAAGKGRVITINHPEILKTLKTGDQIYFADGAIRTTVVSRETDKVIAKVLVGGELVSRKGVNFPAAKLPISAITEKDRLDIAFGVAQEVDYIALSFVRSAADIAEARKLIAELGGDTPIVAKIEKAEALDRLDEIIAAADGIMVARGDLGVELGVHKVPVAQKRIIQKAVHKGIPVITATQMLSSMIASPYPTRAEVSDIANAVLDGTDAVMLSDETAVGNYPEEAIRVLQGTIEETETMYRWDQKFTEFPMSHQAIAASATALSKTAPAAAIVTFTYSGLAAKMTARHRPQTRIIAVTSNPKTYRRLAAVWGIEPFFAQYPHANSDKAISLFYKRAIKEGFFEPDDRFIVTIGHHSSQSGSTNQIQLIDRECVERLEAELKGF